VQRRKEDSWTSFRGRLEEEEEEEEEEEGRQAY
jgi:hypothetical protein